MALPLRSAEGADIGASESLPDPESVARHIGTNRTPIERSAMARTDRPCSTLKPDSPATFLTPANCHLELVDIGQIALTIEFRFRFVLLSCVCELINAYPWNWRPRGSPRHARQSLDIHWRLHGRRVGHAAGADS